MKVALVCSSFFLDRSYQENVWAEQLIKAGHQVRVISSGPADVEPQTVQGPTGGYEVQRVKTRVLPRSIYIAAGVADTVAQFKPDLVVIYGDKRFTAGVMTDTRLATLPIISTYSENYGMHEYDWRKPGIGFRQRIKALGFQVIRGRPIRQNCRRSNLIVGNTPHTREIILRLFHDPAERAAIDEKLIHLPLGFSPDHYGFDAALRLATRNELGLSPDEVVVITTSRFDPDKAASIKLIIDGCRAVMKQRAGVKAILVGFADTQTSREIARYIEQGPFRDRFIAHPFVGRARINQLFSAADIAVYNPLTISCQEALGTGLIGCYGDHGGTHEMVRMAEQGAFFRPYDLDDLTEKLSSAVDMLSDKSPSQREALRREFAAASRWLGYDHIIARVLQELQARTHDPTQDR